MSSDLVSYEEARGDIQIYREPKVVLEEATRAAKALGTVLAAKTKKVMMNGEQYLEFEDWQTVGRFYGITAKVTATEFVEYGSAQGFLAKAVALRSDGTEISAAEAMCLNDEEKWSARTKYVYEYVLKDGSRQEEDPPKDKIIWVDNPNKPGSKMPKKERVSKGEVKVPLFQLRSMAQTRACAKTLRNVLAWVVVLAGYRPTPAEELDGITTAEANAALPTLKATKATRDIGFDAKMSDYDPALVAKFVTLYAQSNKVNEGEIKKQAMKNIEGFKTKLSAWIDKDNKTEQPPMSEEEIAEIQALEIAGNPETTALDYGGIERLPNQKDESTCTMEQMAQVDALAKASGFTGGELTILMNREMGIQRMVNLKYGQIPELVAKIKAAKSV